MASAGATKEAKLIVSRDTKALGIWGGNGGCVIPQTVLYFRYKNLQKAVPGVLDLDSKSCLPVAMWFNST